MSTLFALSLSVAFASATMNLAAKVVPQRMDASYAETAPTRLEDSIVCGETKSYEFVSQEVVTWRFELGAPNNVSFSNCDTSFDTKLSVWSEDRSVEVSKTLGGCDGDDCGSCGGFREWKEEFEIANMAAGTYLVDIAPYGANRGEYILTVQCSIAQSPTTAEPGATMTTNEPTMHPTAHTTTHPSDVPSRDPTAHPSADPSASWPTAHPSAAPSAPWPTAHPSAAPSRDPTVDPTQYPTANPSSIPSDSPTMDPTHVPTGAPTADPSAHPSVLPTRYPTAMPTAYPTDSPTADPTAQPSWHPHADPTSDPTTQPTVHTAPTQNPTPVPSRTPTSGPTRTPSTSEPTSTPTRSPTGTPITVAPTQASPTSAPSRSYTLGDVACGDTETFEFAIGDQTPRFYRFAPADVRTVHFSNCDSTFDTTLEVWTKDMSEEVSYTLGGCDGDDCGDCVSNVRSEEFEIDALPADAYIVRIAPYGGASGEYVLHIYCSEPTVYASAPLTARPGTPGVVPAWIGIDAKGVYVSPRALVLAVALIIGVVVLVMARRTRTRSTAMYAKLQMFGDSEDFEEAAAN